MEELPKIKPSQEFVTACHKEAKRIAEEIVPHYLNKYQGMDDETRIITGMEDKAEIHSIMKGYSSELQKKGISEPVATELSLSYGSYLSYLLRHSNKSLVDPLTGEAPKLHF